MSAKLWLVDEHRQFEIQSHLFDVRKFQQINQTNFIFISLVSLSLSNFFLSELLVVTSVYSHLPISVLIFPLWYKWKINVRLLGPLLLNQNEIVSL